MLIDVDHDHFGSVADVQATRGIINRQVIPSAFTTHGDFFEEMIRTLGGSSGVKASEQTKTQNYVADRALPILSHMCPFVAEIYSFSNDEPVL
jgi:hypothetical protein